MKLLKETRNKKEHLKENGILKLVKIKKEKRFLEKQGIDPSTSYMLSKRSTT